MYANSSEIPMFLKKTVVKMNFFLVQSLFEEHTKSKNVKGNKYLSVLIIGGSDASEVFVQQ